MSANNDTTNILQRGHQWLKVGIIECIHHPVYLSMSVCMLLARRTKVKSWNSWEKLFHSILFVCFDNVLYFPFFAPSTLFFSKLFFSPFIHSFWMWACSLLYFVKIYSHFFYSLAADGNRIQILCCCTICCLVRAMRV